MNTLRYPVARLTHAIVFLCVGVQLLMLLMGPAFSNWLIFSAGIVPARFSGEIVGLAVPVPPMLTLITHMFLHGGVIHLAMNMLFLMWIGRQTEWAVGPFRFALLFLAGGIAGGLLQMMISPASAIPVIGASGAISAVFGAYALLFATSGEAPATIMGIRISGTTVRAFRYASLWIGLQLLTAVAFNDPAAAGASPIGQIAIWTHIGGFLAGLPFGLYWMRQPDAG